jgi:recombination protein RecA
MPDLEALKNQIRKDNKDAFAFTLLDSDFNIDVESISSGLIGVDRILRVDGFPRGKIIELYGLESTGKSTLALQTIAEANRQGESCVYFDQEGGLERKYVDTLGIDKKKFLIIQVDSGEELFKIILEQIIPMGDIGVVVIDSLASLVPIQELESELTKDLYAVKARMMAKALRKIAKPLSGTDTVLIIINQLIANIGGYGTTTPGGKALRFYASVRISLEFDKDLSIDEKEGMGIRMHVRKNKVGTPHHECTQLMLYGSGFDKLYDVVNEGMMLNIIEKRSSWYVWGDEKFQGLSNMRTYFRKYPEQLEELKNEVTDEWDEQRSL